MSDWQERTRLLCGDAAVGKFSNSTVAVVGVGGVGGYAAEMLVRAGIGHIIIVDCDSVSESNKNRQILALDSTLGRPKCDVLSERLHDINRDLDLTGIEKYVIADEALMNTEVSEKPMKIPFPENSVQVHEIFDGKNLDYVVDAIDTLGPKLSLIRYCLDKAIPLVSSMGAGAKFDATKVRVTDISETYQCPLAHMLRKRLHKMGIRSGFKAVFSEEQPIETAMVPGESCNKKTQVGTISYIPAVFGCVCAQTVICDLMK
jgi:tRNA A37 threonylcarbamoyladenosine dehydratase